MIARCDTVASLVAFRPHDRPDRATPNSTSTVASRAIDAQAHVLKSVTRAGSGAALDPLRHKHPMLQPDQLQRQQHPVHLQALRAAALLHHADQGVELRGDHAHHRAAGDAFVAGEGQAGEREVAQAGRQVVRHAGQAQAEVAVAGLARCGAAAQQFLGGLGGVGGRHQRAFAGAAAGVHLQRDAKAGAAVGAAAVGLPGGKAQAGRAGGGRVGGPGGAGRAC